MGVKAALQRTYQRPNDEGTDDGREDRMRCQDRQVDRSDEPFTGKTCRAQAEIVGPQSVIGEIKHQENSRERTSRQHAGTMSVHFTAKDKDPASDEKYAA